MKKSMKIFLVAFFLLVNCGLLFSQETRIELGDKYFDQYAYVKAIRLYEEAIQRDKNNWNIYAKLGDCYYFTSNPKEAIDNYKIALANKTYNMDNYRLKYALSMLSVNSCTTVIEQLTKDKDSITIKVIGKYFGLEKELKENPKNIQALICQKKDNPEPEIVENLSINSDSSDFGSYIFKDILYFSSSRKNPDKDRKLNKRLYKWNEHPFLDIYSAAIDRNANDSFKKVPSDSSKIGINTVAHEAGITITNDSMYMYYSGGNVKNGKLEYNNRGTSNLKLKRATWNSITNKWVETIEDKKALDGINLENYSVGSPALSPDNKWLLFVTCAPYSDAQGQTDIYYVKIDVKNDSIIYGKPKNLSQSINTSGRESFPFISKDSTLYFSSDGIYDKKLGSGLLDIYKVYNIDKLIEQRELNNDIDSMEVVNLGAPINSPMDDFAFFIEEPKTDDDCEVYAYFSSNREVPEAKGDDDIYRVKVKIPKTIRGTIKDSKTGDYLSDAVVELIDSTGMVLDTLKVSSSGSFNFKVNCDNTFKLRGSKKLYDDDLKEFNSSEASDGINLELKPYPCEITINYAGFDSINQIEFERDAVRITEGAKKTLKQVWDMLSTNPDIKIRIESHTDSRGSDDYNLRLSERRAQASKSYLDSLGGDKESQITNTKGYGESMLCISDEKIENLPTEKERDDAHQRNRRSRFIIVDCEDNTPDCSNDN
jgi:outer membrane protein OmpA-like peptidoglycan-associated protein/tetratricopeptide (TPR) repeat protein